MKIFLAGTCSRPWVFEKHKPLFVLESFYYIKPWQIKEIKNWKMFMLDSGAFTFFSYGKDVDWDDYINKYADFINENNIEYFFELDIDALIGYENVLKLRKKLESKTGKQCIPVWHRSRGIKEWQAMCDEYSYVAIGGIVSKEIKPAQYTAFPSMIAEAHRRGAKVHGLGFTSEKAFSMNFDSVDSTNWLSSSRFGNVEYFDGKKIKKFKTPKGKKPAYYKIRDDFVVQEWIKFQKYAEANL